MDSSPRLRDGCNCRSASGRKAHKKSTAGSVGIIHAGDLASMLPHDAVTNAQAEASSLADFFCRVERLEDAFRLRNPRSVVSDRDLHPSLALRRGDLDAPHATDFAHGVIGIVQDVEKHLLELIRIPKNRRNVRTRVLNDFNTLTGGAIGAELDYLFEYFLGDKPLASRRHLAREAQQVVDDFLRTLCFLQHDAQLLFRLFGNLRILKKQI